MSAAHAGTRLWKRHINHQEVFYCFCSFVLMLVFVLLSFFISMSMCTCIV